MRAGIDYFPLDVALDEKFELIEAEFGLTGFAVVVKLLQRIYAGCGYYCEWTNEVALLFAKNVGLGGNAVSEIVSASIKRGIFDKTLYDKYHILTSCGIQKRYFEAVSRRKSVEVDGRYLLLDCAHFLKNVDISFKNVDILNENADISKQSKVKESRVKESRITTTTTRAHVDTETEEEEAPSYLQVAVYMRDELCVDNAAKEAEKFCAYNAVLKWSCLPDWKAAAELWCARIGEKR